MKKFSNSSWRETKYINKKWRSGLITFKNTTLCVLAANVGPMMQKMCEVDLMTNQNALYDSRLNAMSNLWDKDAHESSQMPAGIFCETNTL